MKLDSLDNANYISIALGLVSIGFSLYNFWRARQSEIINNKAKEFKERFLEEGRIITSKILTIVDEIDDCIRKHKKGIYSIESIEAITSHYVKLQRRISTFITNIKQESNYNEIYVQDYITAELDRAAESINNLNQTNSRDVGETLHNLLCNLQYVQKKFEGDLYAAKRKIKKH